MALFASSYIPTVASNVTRNADSLSFAIGASPESLTIYVRMYELGPQINLGVVTIGSLTNTTPRLTLWRSATTTYQILLTTAAASVVVTPNPGDLIELRGTLSVVGLTATVQLGVTQNGGSEVLSGTSNQVVPQMWQSQNVLLNAFNASSVGFIALHRAYILRGVQSLASMRRYAGVA